LVVASTHPRAVPSNASTVFEPHANAPLENSESRYGVWPPSPMSRRWIPYPGVAESARWRVCGTVFPTATGAR